VVRCKGTLFGVRDLSRPSDVVHLYLCPMQEGKLIIFSAPSGAGKTTIVKHLLQQGLPLAFSISATNRSMRHGEEHGRDYWFLSTEEFRALIDQGAFLEWEEVYDGQYYGTLRSEVDRLHAIGHHVVFDVDVVGGLNIKRQYADDALAVFVMPPSVEELEKRLRSRRSESEEALQRRVQKAAHELTFANHFDRVVLNDDLMHAQEEALQAVLDFLDA
jgi:guanylate kinase